MFHPGGVRIVVLHEFLDRQIAAGILITEEFCDLLLLVEMDLVVLAAGEVVEFVADAPQVIVGTLEFRPFPFGDDPFDDGEIVALGAGVRAELVSEPIKGVCFGAGGFAEVFAAGAPSLAQRVELDLLSHALALSEDRFGGYVEFAARTRGPCSAHQALVGSRSLGCLGLGW